MLMIVGVGEEFGFFVRLGSFWSFYGSLSLGVASLEIKVRFVAVVVLVLVAV